MNRRSMRRALERAGKVGNVRWISEAEYRRVISGPKAPGARWEIWEIALAASAVAAIVLALIEITMFLVGAFK